MMMRSAAAFALAVGAMAAVGTTGEQTAEARAAATHGCAVGYVCIYPEGAGWNNDRPSLTYYKYGTYNLSNQVGVHRIYNNQSGNATMRTCTGYDGVGCQGYLYPGSYIDKDLTPINSITLQG
jgi:hypothetical protein